MSPAIACTMYKCFLYGFPNTWVFARDASAALMNP